MDQASAEDQQLGEAQQDASGVLQDQQAGEAALLAGKEEASEKRPVLFQPASPQRPWDVRLRPHDLVEASKAGEAQAEALSPSSKALKPLPPLLKPLPPLARLVGSSAQLSISAQLRAEPWPFWDPQRLPSASRELALPWALREFALSGSIPLDLLGSVGMLI